MYWRFIYRAKSDALCARRRPHVCSVGFNALTLQLSFNHQSNWSIHRDKLSSDSSFLFHFIPIVCRDRLARFDVNLRPTRK